jgi:hypothetical protein
MAMATERVNVTDGEGNSNGGKIGGDGNKESNGKGAKSDGYGNKEGNGNSSKIDGNSNKEGNGKGGQWRGREGVWQWWLWWRATKREMATAKRVAGVQRRQQ